MIGGGVHVRDATAADFDRINEIYNWTVVDNHVSFDTEPWDRERRAEWWLERPPELPCLLAAVNTEVAGLAYASRYRPKAAYRTTVETTIVLDPAHRGRGIGTLLLGALLDRLRAAGMHRAIAIVALPNPASIALHHKLGYRTVGTISESGFKLDRYWDTTLLEHDLA